MNEQTIEKGSPIYLAWKRYHHLWKHEEVPARHFLLKEGEICRRVYVIEKGSVRSWFNHDGKDISFQFFFEKDVVTSSESFRKNASSLFNIQTVEPATLRWLDQNDMKLIRQDSVLYDFMVGRASEQQDEFMQHFFSYLKYSPQKRYEHLLNERPEIVKRIPLQYIASYLGITQVSLSRIRLKIR